MKWVQLALLLLCFFEPIIPIIAFLLLGVYEWFADIPYRASVRRWNQIFADIGMGGKDTPNYLFDKEISKYAKQIVFKTLIPPNVWESKKEALEMHINKKILSIIQDEDNNRIIRLIIAGEPLTSDIAWSEDYFDYGTDFLNIGISYFGFVGMDLTKHPHAFVAGETGSGKSNILKCMIHQSLNKYYDVVLIDFKRGVAFSGFSDYIDMHFDYKSAIEALKGVIVDTNRRLDLFRESRVDSFEDYNEHSGEKLRRKILFIDEVAELLKTRDKEISNILYDSLETITRLSRATGIHLIMGIQRPDSTIISGQIKNNVPFRVCGRFVDPEPSRIMLNNESAIKLPNIKGRFLIKDDVMHEVQCFYYSNSSLAGLWVMPRSKINAPTMNEEKAKPSPIKQETAPRKSEVLSDDLNFDFSDK